MMQREFLVWCLGYARRIMLIAAPKWPRGHSTPFAAEMELEAAGIMSDAIAEYLRASVARPTERAEAPMSDGLCVRHGFPADTGGKCPECYKQTTTLVAGSLRPGEPGDPKLVADLEEKIKRSHELGEEPDAASWGYEEGVLISRREAEALLAALRRLGGGEPQQEKTMQASYTTEEVVAHHGDPVWEAIWGVIRQWDLSRSPDPSGAPRLYMGATGDDATRIYDAISPFLRSAAGGGEPQVTER